MVFFGLIKPGVFKEDVPRVDFLLWKATVQITAYIGSSAEASPQHFLSAIGGYHPILSGCQAVWAACRAD